MQLATYLPTYLLPTYGCQPTSVSADIVMQHVPARLLVLLLDVQQQAWLLRQPSECHGCVSARGLAGLRSICKPGTDADVSACDWCGQAWG